MMTTPSFATKYKVIQKIGEGSFSEVLKCEDKLNGKLYAAKKLKKVFKSATDVMSCAEIIAMHKLSRHPNVLYMIEYFYEPAGGRLIYVFELMDMSMYEFMKMKKRCLPEAKVKGYLFQMLKGLEHLHKNGLFHRDIKPENILIQMPALSSPLNTHLNELVKLADLGSIRGIYSRPPYTEYISTRWYRSPECLLSVGFYGPKMDVWAAGCVFYEMLTLKPLFPGTNEIDQLSKIHNVLGTPSSRLINKLKKKSHNCQNFPRQMGIGLNPLTGSFSEDGQNVLKLMIQYDPENRINVRRLVEHRYFAPLREHYLLGHFKYTSQLQNMIKTDSSFTKGKGDHMINFMASSDKWRQNKYQSISSKLDGTDRLLKHKRSPLTGSKTSTDINYIPNKPKTHLLREGVGPLVTQKQFKQWGVDPTMLKPKERQRNTKEQPAKLRSLHQKKTSRPFADAFRSTTSNLPQTFLGSGQNNDKHQFLSKSFVIPRRIIGKVKLETIKEANSTNQHAVSKESTFRR